MAWVVESNAPLTGCNNCLSMQDRKAERYAAQVQGVTDEGVCIVASVTVVFLINCIGIVEVCAFELHRRGRVERLAEHAQRFEGRGSAWNHRRCCKQGPSRAI
jgi:hypothetical protein